MFKFLSSVRKEWLVLLRDKAGLIILFLMPMVLIVIMSLLQEIGYSSITRESRMKVLYVDQDKDSLGLKIRQGLIESNYFELIDSLNSKPLDEAAVRELVKKGDYIIGIIIPKGVTATIRSNVRIMVAKTLAGFGLYNAALVGKIPYREADTVTIYFDPTVKKSFKNTVVSSIKEYNYKIESGMVFRTFNEEMSKLFPNYIPPDIDYKDAVEFKEVFPSYHPVEAIPNAAQHNVPAWAVFAMFFIIIPLTASMITEREEGSLFRLQSMPVSYFHILMGKVTVYLLVCVIQTILMILTGIYILPLFHAVPLEMNNHYVSVAFMTVVSALASLGYGIMVGTIARTHQQAAAFGAVSIIIMAALGGLWVPMYLMPLMMQHVATLSPLNWAISGYYDIFLRQGGLREILPESIKLLGFFVLTVIIAFIYRKIKNPLNK
jgi:ABC-2 type transport system permease protein